MSLATSYARQALDLRFLDRALELATATDRTVEPDPYVGAVVVDAHGAVVGEGRHDVFGGPHAEPLALEVARERARGATVYCTLEPCCYDAPEKRQPACTTAIIAAGVARVAIGAIDPHPRVTGGGVEALRAAGLEVEVVGDQARYLGPSHAYLTGLRERADAAAARLPDPA